MKAKPTPAESVRLATHYAAMEATGTARLLRRWGQFDNSYEARVAKVFGFFLTLPGCKLDDPFVKPVIVEAVERNDIAFFRKLGRALKHKPAPLHKTIEENQSKLTAFLLGHWITSPAKGIPPLCELDPESHVALAAHFLKRDVEAEAVAKLRYRLGLVPKKGSKHRVIRQGGKLVLVR